MKWRVGSTWIVVMTAGTCLAASAWFAGAEDPSKPMKPAEAAKSFTVPADLRIDQVLAEPIVRQPLSINFDEKGRMWVVQYLQYPNPAGLKRLSRDIFWRAVYDKVPAPPPHHFRG